MERSSSRSTIEATMRLFLLRSLNSCSDLLNSPPFKALPLFEKPHVRAAPSRFAHSAPKQGHRASRAFANPTIGFALGNYSRAIPLAARTSSAGGMPTTQNAHLLWWFARYFCSTAPLGGRLPWQRSYSRCDTLCPTPSTAHSTAPQSMGAFTKMRAMADPRSTLAHVLS